jgi:hypothetical protein
MRGQRCGMREALVPIKPLPTFRVRQGIARTSLCTTSTVHQWSSLDISRSVSLVLVLPSLFRLEDWLNLRSIRGEVEVQKDKAAL